MKENVKKQLKESFLNVQFIVVLLVTMGSLIWLIANWKSASIDNRKFFICIFLGSLFILILFVVGFFRGIRLRDNADSVKSGKIKYEPYVVDKDTFIKECKMGLINSIVRIDGKIYELETQLDKGNSTDYDKFTCYINETMIIGVDNFLNYKYDGIHCLNELNRIEFLEYNSNDPRVYFEEHKI